MTNRWGDTTSPTHHFPETQYHSSRSHHASLSLLSFQIDRFSLTWLCLSLSVVVWMASGREDDDEAPASSSSSCELPVQFTAVHDDDMSQLRVLHNVTLPVRYQDKFYKEMRSSQSLSQLAFHEGEMIGAICSRIESVEGDTSASQLYIMTMSVLSAYRGMGVGSRLLERVIQMAQKEERFDIRWVYLHVQVIHTHTHTQRRRTTMIIAIPLSLSLSHCLQSSALILSSSEVQLPCVMRQ